jgi:hypothetical protein
MAASFAALIRSPRQRAAESMAGYGKAERRSRLAEINDIIADIKVADKCATEGAR